jgi:hydroxymethylpyrimidine/phosphomethylpyrimidine kinase
VWAERIPTIHTHGTGCTYAAAITARLARGWGVEAAVRSAHTYLQGAIRHATGLGGGIGPVYHGWQHARLKDKG